MGISMKKIKLFISRYYDFRKVKTTEVIEVRFTTVKTRLPISHIYINDAENWFSQSLKLFSSCFYKYLFDFIILAKLDLFF